MANTRGRFIAERDWPDWRKLLQEFRAVGRTLRKPKVLDGSNRRGFTLRLARTSAAHAAGATQAVNLCDPDFVELSPVKTVDAVNDSEVEIPDDTKIYIASFAGKTRIVQAFICTE